MISSQNRLMNVVKHLAWCFLIKQSLSSDDIAYKIVSHSEATNGNLIGLLNIDSKTLRAWFTVRKTFFDLTGAVLGLEARAGRAGEILRRFSFSFSSLFRDLSKNDILVEQRRQYMRKDQRSSFFAVR
jgi:hypothetical protein